MEVLLLQIDNFFIIFFFFYLVQVWCATKFLTEGVEKSIKKSLHLEEVEDWEEEDVSVIKKIKAELEEKESVL
jgi:hypothetical protein